MDFKTNVMRIIEGKKISYKPYDYSETDALSASEVAAVLGQKPECVFKTLVTVGKSGEHYVFMLPADEELDLKKAARAVGEKSVEMLKSKELLPLTGYIHGGCSPIGMKKFFRTIVHESAKKCSTIFFSAGKIGYQIEMNPLDLERIIRLRYADLIADA